MPKKIKQKNSKTSLFIFSIGIAAAAIFVLAVCFDFPKARAQAVSGWAKGIWNNYVVGHTEDDPAVPPTIGWLKSSSKVAGPCAKNSDYGVMLDGNDQSNPRTLRGAAWFGIGSQADAGGACQADSPSLGWLNFDTGFPSFCPGDCLAAQWEKKTNGTGSEGIVRGWAQVSSMSDNGWVHIYGAQVDADGNIIATGDRKNYAWNSGAADMSIQNNQGLGWIDLTGLKINNCTGGVSCSTREMCPGLNIGDPGALPCTAQELCSGNDGATVTCSGRTWTCSNGCMSCAGTIIDKKSEDGECGTFNGGFICGQEEKPDSYCKRGTKHIINSSSLTTIWTCGADACGETGHQVPCSANTRCGWIETNPSN